jgi:hypothetical protein
VVGSEMTNVAPHFKVKVDLQSDETGSKNLVLLRDKEHHTSSKQSPCHVRESGEKK